MVVIWSHFITSLSQRHNDVVGSLLIYVDATSLVYVAGRLQFGRIITSFYNIMTTLLGVYTFTLPQRHIFTSSWPQCDVGATSWQHGNVCCGRTSKSGLPGLWPFKVQCHAGIGLLIYGFLLMVNGNIWLNVAPLQDIHLRLWNLGVRD